jgi:hypothetical protein
MSIFTTTGGSSPGLQLLAAVATGPASGPQVQLSFSGPSPSPSSLHSKWPNNPAVALPPKVAKRILDLEYVEMSEISIDDHLPHTPGQPPLPACHPVQNISIWIKKFSVTAAVLTSRFPEKGLELLTYQLPGLNCTGGTQFRQLPLGRLRPLLQTRGPVPKELRLVNSECATIQ